MVNFNFIKTEFNSGVIVIISLLFRFVFSYVVKLVRFTSKSLETTLITFVIAVMFSLNYVVLYKNAPQNFVTDQELEQNQYFIPYVK